MANMVKTKRTVVFSKNGKTMMHFDKEKMKRSMGKVAEKHGLTNKKDDASKTKLFQNQKEFSTMRKSQIMELVGLVRDMNGNDTYISSTLWA